MTNILGEAVVIITTDDTAVDEGFDKVKSNAEKTSATIGTTIEKAEAPIKKTNDAMKETAETAVTTGDTVKTSYDKQAESANDAGDAIDSNKQRMLSNMEVAGQLGIAFLGVAGGLFAIKNSIMEVNSISDVPKAFGEIAANVGVMTASIAQAIPAITQIVPPILAWIAAEYAKAAALWASAAAFIAANAPIIAIGIAIVALIAIIVLLIKYWDEIVQAVPILGTALETVKQAISSIAEVMFNDIKTRIDGIIQVIHGFEQIITGFVNLISALFHGDWAAAWDAMQQIASGVMDVLVGTVKAQLGSIPSIIVGVISEAASAAQNLASAIYNGIVDGIKSLPDFVMGVINSIKNAISSFRLRFHAGGQDLGPLGHVPEVDLTIQPFSWLAQGTPLIPFDNFPAMLHKNEAVIPADLNPFNPDATSPLGLTNNGMTLNFPNATIVADSRRSAVKSLDRIGVGIKLRARGHAS